jgi:hypothetical protein
VSWNNVLPWWVYEAEYERFLAKCTCALEPEWLGGISKVLPDHVQEIIQQNWSEDDVH